MAIFNGVVTSQEEKILRDKERILNLSEKKNNEPLIQATFGNAEGEYPVEAGRYRLIWSRLCPFAQRNKIIFYLLGLDAVISTGTVNTIKSKNGWDFSDSPGGVDPVLRIHTLEEIYDETNPDYQGRALVPTLVDTKTHKVISNDYYRLPNQWETDWKPFFREGAPDLYPEELREDIDKLNDEILYTINSGVYAIGRELTEEGKEHYRDIFYKEMDVLEERLSHSRYLFGDQITDSDIRLYVTLVRFDTIYSPLFRVNVNRKALTDYKNLWNYTRDLYQTPGFSETTYFEDIIRGYLAHYPIEIQQQIPLTVDRTVWLAPHGREKID